MSAGNVGYSEGWTAPASITREFGHKYRWLRDGNIYKQIDSGVSNNWMLTSSDTPSNQDGYVYIDSVTFEDVNDEAGNADFTKGLFSYDNKVLLSVMVQAEELLDVDTNVTFNIQDVNTGTKSQGLTNIVLGNNLDVMSLTQTDNWEIKVSAPFNFPPAPIQGGNTTGLYKIYALYKEIL